MRLKLVSPAAAEGAALFRDGAQRPALESAALDGSGTLESVLRRLNRYRFRLGAASARASKRKPKLFGLQSSMSWTFVARSSTWEMSTPWTSCIRSRNHVLRGSSDDPNCAIPA